MECECRIRVECECRMRVHRCRLETTIWGRLFLSNSHCYNPNDQYFGQKWLDRARIWTSDCKNSKRTLYHCDTYPSVFTSYKGMGRVSDESVMAHVGLTRVYSLPRGPPPRFTCQHRPGLWPRSSTTTILWNYLLRELEIFGHQFVLAKTTERRLTEEFILECWHRFCLRNARDRDKLYIQRL